MISGVEGRVSLQDTLGQTLTLSNKEQPYDDDDNDDGDDDVDDDDIN